MKREKRTIVGVRDAGMNKLRPTNIRLEQCFVLGALYLVFVIHIKDKT
jgi:hypothetical protein